MSNITDPQIKTILDHIVNNFDPEYIFQCLFYPKPPNKLVSLEYPIYFYKDPIVYVGVSKIHSISQKFIINGEKIDISIQDFEEFYSKLESLYKNRVSNNLSKIASEVTLFNEFKQFASSKSFVDTNIFDLFKKFKSTK